MLITVINGTEKHGVTWRLKELFLEPFRSRAEITEYDLPKDGPAYCTGCVNCVLKGENFCRDAACIQKIEESLRKADLIVMTSPAYVMHVTGAVKSLLDHFAYRWMPHRPAPEMFQKRAVIITQCLGAGAKSAAKDIRHSLSWWGISKISVFSEPLLEDIVWEKLTDKRKRKLGRKIRILSEKCSRIDYGKPARTNVVTRAKFCACRMMQKSLYKNNPGYLDAKYWSDQGWLEKKRPWKRQES